MGCNDGCLDVECVSVGYVSYSYSYSPRITPALGSGIWDTNGLEAREFDLLIIIRIRLPLTTITQPIQFPQLSPVLLCLDFIPRHLLLLLQLQLGQIVSYIFGARVGSAGSGGGWSSRCDSGSTGSTRLGGGSGRRSGWVLECVLDDGDFTLVGELTVINVPDFGA